MKKSDVIVAASIAASFLEIGAILGASITDMRHREMLIKYGVAENSKVQIVIYDMSGKQVESIVNEFQTPGYYSVSWYADNQPSSYGMSLDRYLSNYRTRQP